MFERYTKDARRAIFYALHVAEFHDKVNSISPAHLLAGLSYNKDSRANQIYSMYENSERLWAILGISHAECCHKHDMQGPKLPLNPNAKMALAYASDEANRAGQYWIDTDSLLCGLLRFDNEATAALKSIPLDLEITRKLSKLHRKKHPGKYAPVDWYWQKYHLILKPIVVVIVGALAALIIRLVN